MRTSHLVALIALGLVCSPARTGLAEDAPAAPPAPAAGAALAPAQVPQAPEAPVLLSPEELEKLIGPVALYPDVVLSSLLPATAYPIQVVMAARYVKEKGGTVTQVPEDKGWDASVLGLLQFPDVLAWLDENPEWMEQVAYALANQQRAVLAAVQTCRRKTQANGALKTNEYQKVTEVPAPPAEGEEPPAEETVIVVESASPEVVYVPTYDYETVSSPAYVSTYPGLAFGAGVFFGAVGAWAGYELGWWGGHGGGDIDINNNWNHWSGDYKPPGDRPGGGANRPGWKPPGPAGGGQRPRPPGWNGGGTNNGWGNRPTNPVAKPSKPGWGAAGSGTRPTGGSNLRPPSRSPGNVGAGAGAGGPPRASTMPTRAAPQPSGVMNGVGGKADSARGRSSLGSTGRPSTGPTARPSGGTPSRSGATPSTRPSTRSSGASARSSTYRPSSGASTRSASSRGSSSMGRSGGRSGGRGGGRGGRR